MKLKTAEEHYNATKPTGWSDYVGDHSQWRSFGGRLVESVRKEIADALREALRLSDGCKIEGLIEYAGSLRIAYESAEAAKKAASVAVDENEDVRNGRVEYMLFSGAKSDQEWLLLSVTTRKRWIDYARNRRWPKVSPGQRVRNAVEDAAGHCGHDVRDDQWEAAAKVLGIKECDA